MDGNTNGRALVLAAHGSIWDSTVQERVNGFVERLRSLSDFDEVSAAFHLGDPSFSMVLDQLRAHRVTVVPLMTSCGYYCETVLPKALAKNKRYQDIDVVTTKPVGTHTGLDNILLLRVARCMSQHGFDPAKTAVVVVGHGTLRSARSSESTVRLADLLGRQHPACEVSPAFLDCEPFVESVLARTKRPFVVVEPFLIGDGPHASRDIPRRLGMTALDGVSLPMTEQIENHTVVCDSAIGTDPGILDLIADLAVRSLPCPSERADSSTIATRVETTKT